MRVRECGAGRNRTICGPRIDQPVILVMRLVMQRDVDGHRVSFLISSKPQMSGFIPASVFTLFNRLASAAYK